MNFLTFAEKKVGICIASILVLFLGAVPSFAYEIVDVDMASNLIERSGEELQILDVRTLEEFASGHIPHAIHINIGDPDFENQISLLKQDIPILVYCKTGVRAKSAASILASKNFIKIYLMEDGIEDWMKANYPVEGSEEISPHEAKTETSFFQSLINYIYPRS